MSQNIHASSTKDASFDDRHTDENHPYDGSGMAQRKCTDLPCLVIFFAYLAGMVAITKWAIENGNPRRLTHGFNYQGELCGVDAPVLSKPLVYWCGAGGVQDNGHPVKLDTQFPICVESCPQSFDTEMACLGVEEVKVSTEGEEPYVTRVTEITQSTIKQMSYPTMEFSGMYCVPHFIKEHVLGDDSLTMQLLGKDGPLGSTYKRLAGAFGGLHRCWLVLVCAIPFAVLVSYMYLFLLRFMAYPAVIISLVCLVLSILSLGIYFVLGEILEGDMLVKWHETNFLFKMFDSEFAGTASKVVGIVFIVLGCLLACGLTAMREAMQIAAGCVAAACECMFSMPAMLVQPAIEAVTKVIVILSLLGGLIMLLSTAEMKPEMMDVKGQIVGGLRRTFTFTAEQWGMTAYYVFGMLWLTELFNSLSQFVVAYAVILWYYHPKPKGFGPSMPLIRGFTVGMIFHLGTFAFGSFLISTLRGTRIILLWISRAAKAENNSVAACIAGCCACCVTLIQRYVEFITKNAYIDVAISSTSFFTAAQNAHGFITSDSGKVALLYGACYIVTAGVVLGNFLMTGGLTWLLVTSNERWTDSNSAHYVENPYFVAVLTGCIGASVAMCFMVIFDHCADTLLYVFLWNRSHGHNTVSKYAPDSLVHLLDYKKISNSNGGRVAPREDSQGIFGSLTSFFDRDAASKKAPEEQQSLLTR
eukprot:TRINITY_DN31333_c0_g1_i1.p1 TRINITY_DN31333_c0_g1~~TRINITY_DN31333_c0_g1_i1.p1  ORF type:complete len:700 (-),score=71.44 TRINITY_DN31333_c0_g1_i1:291-2390(-)